MLIGTDARKGGDIIIMGNGFGGHGGGHSLFGHSKFGDALTLGSMFGLFGHDTIIMGRRR